MECFHTWEWRPQPRSTQRSSRTACRSSRGSTTGPGGSPLSNPAPRHTASRGWLLHSYRAAHQWLLPADCCLKHRRPAHTRCPLASSPGHRRSLPTTMSRMRPQTRQPTTPPSTAPPWSARGQHTAVACRGREHKDRVARRYLRSASRSSIQHIWSSRSTMALVIAIGGAVPPFRSTLGANLTIIADEVQPPDDLFEERQL